MATTAPRPGSGPLPVAPGRTVTIHVAHATPAVELDGALANRYAVRRWRLEERLGSAEALGPAHRVHRP